MKAFDYSSTVMKRSCPERELEWKQISDEKTFNQLQIQILSCNHVKGKHKGKLLFFNLYFKLLCNNGFKNSLQLNTF